MVYFLKNINKLANITHVKFIPIDGELYMTWKYPVDNYKFKVSYTIGILLDGNFAYLQTTSDLKIRITDVDGNKLVGKHMVTYYIIATGGGYNPSNVTSGNHLFEG